MVAAALICVNLRYLQLSAVAKSQKLENAAVWTATGLEYQRAAKSVEVRLLHFPFSIIVTRRLKSRLQKRSPPPRTG